MSRRTLAFSPFTLDPVNQELWRGAERITLRPKVFAVLLYLVEHAQQLVTKHELLDAVWADVSVNDELLRGYVRELRRALGDDAAAPRLIETVSRRGYRFLPAVHVTDSPPEPASAGAPPAHPILVAREIELRALEDALTETVNGRRRTMFIAGEPGTGKTALLSVFLDRPARNRAVMIGLGACAQGYDAGEKFVPVLQALRTLCRQAPHERVVRVLEQYAPAWLAQLPEVVPDDRYEFVEKKGHATPERMRRQLLEALNAIAEETALVLAFEDLHWADDHTIDLVGYLARHGPARLLMIGTYRRVDAIASAHPIRRTALELASEGLLVELSTAAFGVSQVAEYLQVRFPDHALPPAFARLLCERSDGNAARLVKLIDRLVDRGELRQSDGRWRLVAAGEIRESDPTAAVGALLDRRMQELGPVLRGRAPLRVGVLHSLTGMMAWTEMPVVDATLLAIEEINQRGGIRGHRIDPVVVDGQSDEAVFARGAEGLIADQQVCTLFGCWISASRKAVVPIVEQRDHLLVYPVQYEGMERSPNVVYTGAAPNQQVSPAIRWASGFLRKRRFFLVGWDSIYSHAVNAIVRDEVEALGGEIVGEEFLRPHTTDIDRIVRQVGVAGADVIVNTLVGDINVLYARALSAAHTRDERVPTLYLSVSEIELRSLSPRESVGDYAAWNYFQSLDTPQNHAFVSRFRARYGRQRVTADPMEAAYVGVHLWGQAMEVAEASDPRAIRASLISQAYDAPEGLVRVDPETQHVWKTFRLGQILENGQIDVKWSSGQPISPEPFPASRSVDAWKAFLAERYEQWGRRWTRSI